MDSVAHQWTGVQSELEIRTGPQWKDVKHFMCLLLSFFYFSLILSKNLIAISRKGRTAYQYGVQRFQWKHFLPKMELTLCAEILLTKTFQVMNFKWNVGS